MNDRIETDYDKADDAATREMQRRLFVLAFQLGFREQAKIQAIVEMAYGMMSETLHHFGRIITVADCAEWIERTADQTTAQERSFLEKAAPTLLDDAKRAADARRAAQN